VAASRDERRANKLPGFSPYSIGEFAFRSARICRMPFRTGIEVL
jgi:hypothetical protein